MRLRRTGKRGNKVRSRNTRKRQTLRRKFRGGHYAKAPEFDYEGRIKSWDDKLRYEVYENFRKNMEKMIDNQHKMIDLLEAIKKGQNSKENNLPYSTETK